MKKEYVTPKIEWVPFQLKENISVGTSWGTGDPVEKPTRPRNSSYQLDDSESAF